LNESNDDSRSIVQRIVDGNVIINTVEEFEKVLNLFPDDPRMLRAYGDLLADKESKEAAAEPYRRASKLFIENGQSLQAIVTKILEWSIVKPTHSDGRIFHAAISACRSQESPLQNFFAQMAYPEMVAIMLRLVRVRLPAHYLVIEANDISNEIYFIVSGSLSETTYPSADERGAATNPSKAILLENDIFGNVIPFEKENVSRSDVETLTRAELVKLSKPVLMSVCKKFPKVERRFFNGSTSWDRWETDPSTKSPVIVMMSGESSFTAATTFSTNGLLVVALTWISVSWTIFRPLRPGDKLEKGMRIVLIPGSFLACTIP